MTAWSAVMIAMPFLGPSGRQVALIGNPSQALRAVRTAGGTIVEVRRNALIARSDTPHFAAALYRAGARLVLEGRLAAGCLGKRRTKAFPLDGGVGIR